MQFFILFSVGRFGLGSLLQQLKIVRRCLLFMDTRSRHYWRRHQLHHFQGKKGKQKHWQKTGGETGRTLKIRMTEHKRTFRLRDVNNSLAIHSLKTGQKENQGSTGNPTVSGEDEPRLTDDITNNGRNRCP